MEINLFVLAGAISTTIFALSTLPMLLKAFKTKDLKSYSLGNILLSNVGNGIHSFYVFSLPFGPIWLLHTFNLVTTGLMLYWYLRYESRPGIQWSPGVKDSMTGRASQSASPAHISVHKARYPSKIPDSGHASVLILTYTGTEASQSQIS